MLAHLEADRLRAADLDAQIMDLKRCLAALKTEKVSVRERLDSYRYPVLTLPNELISEIFIRFLPVYPRCPPLIGLLSPTLLTQICRQWRELSLGTPALWRALPLPNTRLKNQPVHLWLSRSSPCPLAVAFDCRHAKTSEALVAAVSHRIRWEHIEFCLSPSDIRIIDVSMPLLHHLNLQVAAPCMSVIKFTLSKLPLLRIVTLNNYALDSIVLPWAQLTSLTLCEVTPSDCTPVLQQTRNLMRCKLAMSSLDYGDAGQQPNIRLPYLVSFFLTGWVSSVDGYLENFITPSLKTLTISQWLLRPERIGVFKSFVSKSGCSIQKVLVPEYMSRMDIYREAFPTIQFSGKKIGDSDFDFAKLKFSFS